MRPLWLFVFGLALLVATVLGHAPPARGAGASGGFAASIPTAPLPLAPAERMSELGRAGIVVSSSATDSVAAHQRRRGGGGGGIEDRLAEDFPREEGPLSYVSLDPVRNWDFDLVYRWERDKDEETSLPFGYQVKGQQTVQELSLTVRRRLRSRWIGLLHVPLRHRRVREDGWQLTETGWAPFHVSQKEWVTHPVGIGWRREETWLSPADWQWGADVFLEGSAGWTITPRLRWTWLRDPIVLRVGLEAPWRLSSHASPKPSPALGSVSFDYAINSRFVVSGGIGLRGDELMTTWGWSLQVLPNQYWNVQWELPMQGEAVTIQSGWRLRL